MLTHGTDNRSQSQHNLLPHTDRALRWQLAGCLVVALAATVFVAVTKGLAQNQSPATPYTPTSVRATDDSAGGTPQVPKDETTRAGTEVQLQSHGTATDPGRATTQTSVTVNGEEVPVDQNGSVRKVITNGNSSVSVSVESTSTTNSGGQSGDAP